ncbi:hypothetical protein [Winogradskya humida]|uniref:YtxH-like protein n=1 Tax=Winogradskya humida TaxID=113566 RepID=A0ABQ3ZHQ8_9ACTN|nr:hypothetical protein [Actinoplanes humidus]GIE18088.1 hypothetical protein Ahu01nite_011900 [Actinoplanes humidus]
MKVVTLAAGLAVGYVLGTRAGREKYEQIVAGARKASSHPRVVQAQEKAKEFVGTGTDAVTQKLASVNPEPTTTDLSDTAVPRPPRRKPVVTTPDVGTTPLV